MESVAADPPAEHHKPLFTCTASLRVQKPCTLQPVRPMADLVQNLKSSWQTYTALVLMAGTVTAFAGLPGRVQRLEERMDRSDTVERYVGCWVKATADGKDASACDSHLTPDVLEYLRPHVP